MPINPDCVGFSSPVCTRSWSSDDTLLYALSVGTASDDPTGPELAFVTENTDGLDQAVLPTFAVIPGSGVPGMTDHWGTYDKAKLVHAEQSIELHRPLPPSATVDVVSTIAGVYDKGSAAVIETHTVGRDAEQGAPLFSNVAKVFIRDAGGWGGDRGTSANSALPDRAPDALVSYRTRPDQALLYRLNGDRNPLHSDPAFAARGGFERPILHGLCTFGFTGRALLHELCASDPARFTSMSGRFTRPVLPGQQLDVSIWRLDEHTAAFRTSTPDGTVVLDGGRCSFTVG